MKKRENFTIDEDLIKEFEKYVEKEQVSKSATVEKLIRDLLSSKKKNIELINKEHVLKLSNLIDELNDYKFKMSSLSWALDDVLNDEVCSELLKDEGTYDALNDIYMNTSLEYDDLACDINYVYEKAVDLLKDKNKSMLSLKDYLSDELNQADKDFMTNSGIDYDKWVEENERLGLDVNRYKYLVNPNIFDKGHIYYFGDKVASKVILNPSFIFDETFGIKVVAERERLYANNNDYLRFHPEFNQFALYYFLKDYKEIEKDKVFEVFKGLYSSITENGVDKIPSEVVEYIMEYIPYTKDEIVNDVNESLNKVMTENDTVEVYRYLNKDKINFKNDLDWFLHKKFIENIDVESGVIIKGKIIIKDILAVNDIDYGHIYAKYNDIKDIGIVEK